MISLNCIPQILYVESLDKKAKIIRVKSFPLRATQEPQYIRDVRTDRQMDDNRAIDAYSYSASKTLKKF